MTHRKSTIVILAVLLAVGASVSAVPAPIAASRNSSASKSVTVPSTAITGDYVEARTAAVFAGACHYNGEYVTTGRDAVMAWNFTSGTHEGVSLAGVRVVAAVTSQANLSDASPTRKSDIVVDSSATIAQANAVVSLLKSKCGDSLGTVSEIRRAPIAFTHLEQAYRIKVEDFATLSVKHLPDDSCCTQAGDVWYEPLSSLQWRKVGYTELASFTGPLTAPWYRCAENSAFYGHFQF